MSTGSGSISAYTDTRIRPSTAGTMKSRSMLLENAALNQVATMIAVFCAIPIMPEVLPYCAEGS